MQEIWWDEVEGDIESEAPHSQCSRARPLVQMASYEYTAKVDMARHFTRLSKWHVTELRMKLPNEEYLRTTDELFAAWVLMRSTYPAAALERLGTLSVSFAGDCDGCLMLAWQGACARGLTGLRAFSLLGRANGSALHSPLVVSPSHNATTPNQPIFVALLSRGRPTAFAAERASPPVAWMTATYQAASHRHLGAPSPSPPRAIVVALLPLMALLAVVLAAAFARRRCFTWRLARGSWCWVVGTALLAMSALVDGTSTSYGLRYFLPGMFTPLPFALYPLEEACFTVCAFMETCRSGLLQLALLSATGPL